MFILTWFLQRPKMIAFLVLAIVFGGLVTAYAWQKSTIAKKQSIIEDLQWESRLKQKEVDTLRQNIKDIEGHVKRVEVIRYKSNVIKEYVAVTVKPEIPIVSAPIVATQTEKEVCKRYVERETKSNKQMESVQAAARVITDYYNDKLHTEDYSKIRAEILSKTYPSGSATSRDVPAVAP